MNLLGSKTIETQRLILKAQTMQEQKRLWEILMIPSVNIYYLNTPKKHREKIKDWDIQKVFYEEKINKANNNNVFDWSIFLKDTGECIGKIDFHDISKDYDDVEGEDIKGVGWYLDPAYHRKGYATEAAEAVFDYMFNEVGLSGIETGTCCDNVSSWKLMERLGFKRLDYTKATYYTYIEEAVRSYRYSLTREMYLNNKSRKLLNNNTH